MLHGTLDKHTAENAMLTDATHAHTPSPGARWYTVVLNVTNPLMWDENALTLGEIALMRGENARPCSPGRSRLCTWMAKGGEMGGFFLEAAGSSSCARRWLDA